MGRERESKPKTIMQIRDSVRVNAFSRRRVDLRASKKNRELQIVTPWGMPSDGRRRRRRRRLAPNAIDSTGMEKQGIFLFYPFISIVP